MFVLKQGQDPKQTGQPGDGQPCLANGAKKAFTSVLCFAKKHKFVCCLHLVIMEQIMYISL